MADTSILDTPIDSLTPTDTQAEPIATEPIATTAADPITGNNTGSSSSYSDSSNGNQVAVLSTLDYSTNLTVVNTTQQITYNTVYNYSSQAAASTIAASASAPSASALVQPTASRSLNEPSQHQRSEHKCREHERASTDHSEPYQT